MALLQTNKTGASSFANPVDVAFTSGNTAGNLIIVAVGGANTTAFLGCTVTDSAGNTPYSQALAINNGSNSIGTFFFYAYNIKAGANTIHVANPNTSNLSVIIREYSGVLNTSDPLDKTQSGGVFVPNTSLTSGATATTTQAQELIVGLGADGFGSGQVYTAGATYGNLTSCIDNSSWNLALEDAIASTDNAYTATFSLASSGNWTCGVATFKLANHNLAFNANRLRPHAFSPGLAR